MKSKLDTLITVTLVVGGGIRGVGEEAPEVLAH